MSKIWAFILAWLKEQVARWLKGAAASMAEQEQPEPRGITRWWHWARNRIGGNLYCLTIGNANFGGGVNSLPACRTDTLAMAELYRGYGAEVRECHNLSASSMWAEIERALGRLGKGKTVIIHVSSHGTQVRDRDGDEADHKDEALCGSDMRLIADDELFARCSDAVTRTGGNLILVLDTCHSGGMARVFAPLDGVRTISEEAIPPEALAEYRARARMIPQVERGNLPYAVLMACEEHTYAYDGVFTPAFVRACKSMGNAYAGQILAEVRGRVRNQTPQFAGEAKIKVFG